VNTTAFLASMRSDLAAVKRAMAAGDLVRPEHGQEPTPEWQHLSSLLEKFQAFDAWMTARSAPLPGQWRRE
jgi:hypothetical protein